MENLIDHLNRSNVFFYLKDVAILLKNKKQNLNQVSAKVLEKRSSFIKSLEKKNTYKTNSFFCPKETLLINSIRTYLEKFAILPTNSDVNGTVTQLKIKKKQTSVLHNLLNDFFWKQSKTYSKGTKMPVLSKRDLLNKIKFYSLKFEFKELNLFSYFTCLNNLEIKIKQIKKLLFKLLI